jgi:hypothetical protein
VIRAALKAEPDCLLDKNRLLSQLRMRDFFALTNKRGRLPMVIWFEQKKLHKEPAFSDANSALPAGGRYFGA